MTKHGLELVYDDLLNTKEFEDENFTTGRLHKTIEGVCYYCAEGILAKRSGINKDLLTDIGTIHGITDLQTMMKLRYEIDFNKKYNNYEKICPLCKNDNDGDNIKKTLTDLEDVITHTNDWHSQNFKDVVTGLKTFAEIYDILGNGEPITSV